MLTILELMEQAHANSKAHGFYEEDENILKWLTKPDREQPHLLKAFFAKRIALIHSELSEALEGDRKELMDDHLSQFEMRTVELADAIIRIADLAKWLGLPLEEAIIAKMEYNKSRPYKHGKAY